MDKWRHGVSRLVHDDIMNYIQCAHWQRRRLQMKELPTTEKLDLLEDWLRNGIGDDYARRVQVDNYINALKRGGQLSMELEVVR